ncbi:hypothetical protein [Pseudomonas sp. NPDC099000]|uniref:hypothetical protein n=1 Tax=Pseudomonas sp. NPDC099000 TaxID=3364488 RepID=UPI00383B2938
MEKKPLYRKINTRTWGVRHNDYTGEYRHQRHTKAVINCDAPRESMHGTRRYGFDYTPLYKFLLSRVGRRWDEVFSEAVARLDSPEPVFWMVALRESEQKDYVRTDESSYFSGLFVDDQGLLAIVAPELTAENMATFCHCCTHSFNGIPYGQRKD